MRNEYDLSRGRRPKRKGVSVVRHTQRDGKNSIGEDDPPLTQTQMQELDRRVKDLHDRTRYLLVSYLSPRFALYYNVSEDTYGMNTPIHATLFKRRRAALAVKRLLGSRLEIVLCRVDRRGRLVLNSVLVPLSKRHRTRNRAARSRR